MSDAKPPTEILSEVIGLMEWLHDCDPWYAEHDGIDIAAKAAEAREALVVLERGLDVERLAGAMAEIERRKLPMSPWNISVAYAAAKPTHD